MVPKYAVVPSELHGIAAQKTRLCLVNLLPFVFLVSLFLTFFSGSCGGRDEVRMRFCSFPADIAFVCPEAKLNSVTRLRKHGGTSHGHEEKVEFTDFKCARYTLVSSLLFCLFTTKLANNA